MTTTEHKTLTIDIDCGVFEVEVKITESYEPGSYDTPPCYERRWTLITLKEVHEDSTMTPVDIMPDEVRDDIDRQVQDLEMEM